MTTLLKTKPTIRHPSNQSKQAFDELYRRKVQHEQKFFAIEREVEKLDERRTSLREAQKYHKQQIFAIDSQIKQARKPVYKSNKPSVWVIYWFLFVAFSVMLSLLMLFMTQQ